MRAFTEIYLQYIDANTPKEKILRALQVASLEARIDERTIIIYTQESAIMDCKENGEETFPPDYILALKDEIANHNAVIADHKKELKKLKKN